MLRHHDAVSAVKNKSDSYSLKRFLKYKTYFSGGGLKT